MDEKIWNNETDYFVEDSDWDENATTLLPAGTDLTRYSKTSKKTTGFYFASNETPRVWIQYK